MRLDFFGNDITLGAQTLISLTCSNFSNYFERLCCIISSSFAFPAHFSFHSLLVDTYCDLSLPPEHIGDLLTANVTAVECATTKESNRK